MQALVLEDTTVELFAQDDFPLTEVNQLLLEITINDSVIDTAKLSSRGSSPGVWKTDKTVVLCEITSEVILSIFMEFNKNERRLLGRMDLHGPELYEVLEQQLEMPLICHENYSGCTAIVRGVAFLAEVKRVTNSKATEQGTPSQEEDIIESLMTAAEASFEDFQRHGTMESLEQAIRQFEFAINVVPEGSSHLPLLLGNLGATFGCRYDHLGQIEDLKNAIVHLQKANELTPDYHPSKPGRLSNLSDSLQRRFERSGSLEDLDTAISLKSAAIKLTHDCHPSRPNHLNGLGFYLHARFQRLKRLEDLDNAIVQQQAAVNFTLDNDPEKRIYLNNLANSLNSRFEHLGNLEDIDTAIVKQQEAISLCLDDLPEKYDYLCNLGVFLVARFQHSGDIDDIDNAIAHLQKVVNLTPHSHPEKLLRLKNLANSMLTRFENLGDLADLDGAIYQQQTVIDLAPKEHPDKPGYLVNLAISLRTRFLRRGNITDIDTSVLHCRSAIELTTDQHPDRAEHLSQLGKSLGERFERLGQITDINESIKVYEMAVSTTPDGHVDKPIYLSNLGACLLLRFESLGDLTDLNDAIEKLRLVINVRDKDSSKSPAPLHNLGKALGARFRRFRDLVDLNNAIEHYETAISLTPNNHPSKPGCLSGLGACLRDRFEHEGNLADIENAIIQQQAAINLTWDNHPHKPEYLSNLGIYLNLRFEFQGNVSDIDESISRHEEAIRILSDNDPRRAKYLNSLGNALWARFGRLGYIEDIQKAIMQQEIAVDITPDEHLSKPLYLNGLGISLHSRFKRLEDLVDLDNSVRNLQAAVDLLTDDNPKKPGLLNNLGGMVLLRFQRGRNIVDMDGAIEKLQTAVNLTPDSDLAKPRYLNNLGASLMDRFECRGDPQDMDNAISMREESVKLSPDGDPEKSSWRLGLASCLWQRFLKSGDSGDAESAISLFSSSARSPVGPPSTRLRAASLWTSTASTLEHTSLLAAYECALEVIPLVAWLGLPIAARHKHLMGIGEAVREAAAVAISLGQYEKAVEWLEQGRSIVWNQILQLRSPVEELKDIDPDLAERLLTVSQLLDHGSDSDVLLGGVRLFDGEEERRYRALTTEWESLVKKVRSLPNFEGFLQPPKIERLMDAAQNGPIIVLNICKKRCDALALLTGLDEVIHIPLPNITYDKVVQLRDELRDLLSSDGIRFRAPRATEREKDEGGEESCKWILSELWNNLVKPVIDSLAFSPHSDTLPRIWWCATGPLAFLPIHAAGTYDTISSDSMLSDYAISSYIPTLSTLLESANLDSNSSFNMLSVIEPSAPGASHIPNAKKELEFIRNRLVDREHVVLLGPEATKGKVIKAVEKSNWIHLACHGVQKSNSIDSALLLRDGNLTLEEIIRLNLPQAEFAFLSACQTTTGDENLSEESAHIAGGMLLAGYRSVVATMWSIQDELAPEVADEFYARIMQEEGRPDSRRAAEALHYAVQKLREKPNIPLTAWIPFVHLGI